MNPVTPAVLSVELLSKIDKYYINAQYSHLRTPLLNYSPEAVVVFAAIIYDYFIVPAGLYPSITRKDYINYLTKTYRESVSTITLALEGFISQLEVITAEPQYAKVECEPHSISEYINYFKTGADKSDYNAKHFPALQDFFYGFYSPLSDLPYANDARINNLKLEANALKRSHSESLTSFIRRELLLLEDNLKEVPTDTNPEISTQDESNFNLYPEVEELLNNYLTGVEQKRQEQIEMDRQQQAKLRPVIQLTKEAEQEKPLMPAEDYLAFFLKDFKDAYARHTETLINTRSNGIDSLNDATAYAMAMKFVHERDGSLDNLDAVIAEQELSKKFYLDYNYLEPILAACIQVDLYNLFLPAVFSPITLSHGVVQAVLAFIEPLMGKFKDRTFLFSYDSLAKELHKELYDRTNYFIELPPLPEIKPLSQEEIESTEKATALAAIQIDETFIPYFDLTPAIRGVLSSINADTITTTTELLSAVPDPKTLVPVNNSVIEDIANFLTGQASTPYLLNGDLIIHNEDSDQFIKVIPTTREDGYLDYKFTAYSHSALSSRIYKLQQLLKTSSKYCSEYLDYHNDHRKYEPLTRTSLAARKEAIEDVRDWAVTLESRARHIFNGDDSDAGDAENKTRLWKITRAHYYKDVFLSAHRLAGYIYHPDAYTSFISAKPVDVEGNRIYYEPNHKDGCRSDNTAENLEIITKQTNLDLRSTSKPVIYQDEKYLTLKSYCDATDAGAYDYLRKLLVSLEQGEVINYSDRDYAINADGVITATDTAQTPQIDYNGTVYVTLKDFATAQSLSYDAIQKGLKRAKDSGKLEYKHKKYKFYLDDKGNINIT